MVDYDPNNWRLNQYIFPRSVKEAWPDAGDWAEKPTEFEGTWFVRNRALLGIVLAMLLVLFVCNLVYQVANTPVVEVRGYGGTGKRVYPLKGLTPLTLPTYPYPLDQTRG